MTTLGLDLATLDLIETSDGHFVFLEVNAVSFFDFVEDATGLPIERAVAELLTGRRRSRCRPST